jgi:uncharacterized membrane protein
MCDMTMKQPLKLWQFHDTSQTLHEYIPSQEDQSIARTRLSISIPLIPWVSIHLVGLGRGNTP